MHCIFILLILVEVSSLKNAIGKQGLISPTCLRACLKITKRQSSHQCLFVLLWSANVKAARRTLVKLTQGVNFINIFCKAFTGEDPKSKKKTVKLSVTFCTYGICKCNRKMLVKLTPGGGNWTPKQLCQRTFRSIFSTTRITNGWDGLEQEFQTCGPLIVYVRPAFI